MNHKCDSLESSNFSTQEPKKDLQMQEIDDATENLGDEITILTAKVTDNSVQLSGVENQIDVLEHNVDEVKANSDNISGFFSN